ncbi:unnamed protein product [Brugia timori]|uniref:Uncharacterized protein n=1 Tax=Brugia timori TaxID=42155 RepID=A0A3P7Z6Y4_9BILA|nr:unnamed protein product [Brugia timori]
MVGQRDRNRPVLAIGNGKDVVLTSKTHFFLQVYFPNQFFL